MYHRQFRKEDRNYSKYFMIGEFNAKKKFHVMEGFKREPRDEQWQKHLPSLKKEM